MVLSFKHWDAVGGCAYVCWELVHACMICAEVCASELSGKTAILSLIINTRRYSSEKKRQRICCNPTEAYHHEDLSIYSSIFSVQAVSDESALTPDYILDNTLFGLWITRLNAGLKKLKSGFCSDNSSVLQLQFHSKLNKQHHWLEYSISLAVSWEFPWILSKTLVPSTGHQRQKQKELYMTSLACIVNAQLAVCHFNRARSGRE